MRRFLILGVIPLAGCYLGHQAPGGAPVPPDTGVDAERRDATPDTGRPAPCPDFQHLDTQPLTFPASDCGSYEAPRVVRLGADFEAVVTEQRFCRDRPGFVFAAPVRVIASRLEIGEPTELLEVLGPSAEVAASGDTLATCSGLRWILRTGSGEVIHARLAPEPMSLPGCPIANVCSGLAGRGDRWLVSFRLFECDVTAAEVATYDASAAARAGPERTYEDIVGVTDYAGGFAYVSRPRGDRATSIVWRWPTGAPTPSEHRVPVEGTHADIVEWPRGSGRLAVAYGRDTGGSGPEITLVSLDASGAEAARRSYRPFEGADVSGFGGPNVSLAAAGFGLVIATRISWDGGADRGALSVMALDLDGDPLAPPFIDIGGAASELDVAATERHVLVHDGRGEQTRALLFGCR